MIDLRNSLQLRRGLARDSGLVLTAVAGTLTPLAVWSPEMPSAMVAILCAVVGGAMYARLALGRWWAALQIFLVASGLALAGVPPPTIVVSILAGSFVAELVARVYPTRMNFVKVGLSAAGVAAIGAATIAGAIYDLAPAQVLRDSASTAAGALLGPGLMLAFAPVAEWLFGHVTPMTLTEWLSYDHPLLQDLAVQAPGTFQHSVNVGLLADAAARACGANPLRCRVGGLYHDVGKLRSPGYFVENQAGQNPHDLLDPVSSAQIIRAHVTDGVVLVRAHHMGRVVADFVREHHGRGLMPYMHQKALDAGGAVRETDFRYDGPSPRSRETGIVMIADQLEATARATTPESLAACEEMARQTIDRIVGNGELAQSGLSRRDLDAIRTTLARTVFAMYHRRLTYPPSPARPVAKSALVSRMFGQRGPA